MFTERTQQYILGLSDEQLLHYLCDGETESYDPDALTFAREELGRRNLPEDRLANLRSAQTEARRAAQAATRKLITQPLDWSPRIFYVAVGGVFWPWSWIEWMRLHRRGMHRMAKESIRCSALGGGLWLIYAGLSLYNPLGHSPASDTIGLVALWGGMLLVIGAIWAIVRLSAKPPKGLCSVCGYDLRATPDRCPECGTEVEA